MSRLLLLLSLFCFSFFASFGQDTLVLKEGLILKLPAEPNKIISPNAFAALIEKGKFIFPADNKPLTENSMFFWKKISPDSSGWFQSDSLVNAYVYFNYNASDDEIVLLEGMGNSMVYVNGVSRSGNPYRYKDHYDAWEPSFSYSLLPVKMNKGDNGIFFECQRGNLKVKIHKIKPGIYFNNNDITVPDIIVNREIDSYGAIPIINADVKGYKNLIIKSYADGTDAQYFQVNNLLPLSVNKNPFLIKLPAFDKTGIMDLKLELISKEGNSENILATTTVRLNVVNEKDTHKETFLSTLDGSVQYYAVNPPAEIGDGAGGDGTGVDKNSRTNERSGVGEGGGIKPALFLSLHGAGVEAINQANSYAHKINGYIVAPTNRRPFGYNWENWGRVDALEVLNIAEKKFDIDPRRVYLTGHSMGGHGTWHLGINYPDRFAAFGPSAGWISIWSYRIKPNTDSTDIHKMLFRSTKQSDTYSFTHNLKSSGLYILQGSADDNVPPAQPLSIIENLKTFHKDFIYHEQPGQGHWWDLSDEPGADCVDWAPMFDFFAHHRLPSNNEVKEIDFTTANLAVSSKNYWVEIINQVKQQRLSHISIQLQQVNRKFIALTENIELLKIDASMLAEGNAPGGGNKTIGGGGTSVVYKPISVIIDSQIVDNITPDNDGKIYLKLTGKRWNVLSGYHYPYYPNKFPARCGNFREAFNNKVMFVYGTHGSRYENEWAEQKAKFEAEKIWYQGNGSILVIPDTAFDRQKNPDGSVILFGQYFDRNVILFGNSETNSAWNTLLDNSPVQVKNGEVRIKDKIYRGDDFACLFIYPRHDSKTASVGVVSGTGIEGLHNVNFAQFFHPYNNFPDIIVYDDGIIKSDEDGVKFTGYFGNDWSVEKGEFIKK